MTALRQRLLEVFEIEYQDHLEAIRSILAKLDDAGSGLARGDLTEAQLDEALDVLRMTRP